MVRLTRWVSLLVTILLMLTANHAAASQQSAKGFDPKLMATLQKMLDPNLFRKQLDETAAQLERRGFALPVERIRTLEDERKQVQVRTQELQNERNTRSKAIGKAKANGDDIAPLLEEVSRLGDELKQHESSLGAIQEELESIALGVPNIPDPSVPLGEDEEDNREERKWGEPTRFNFEPRDHVDLGATGDAMDFGLGSQLAGSRFRPRSTKVGRQSGFSTSSMRRSGSRRSKVAMAISASMRASWAPRQKWMPPPKDSGLTFGRVMSSRSGLSG